ncbi:hypothetical protein BKA81DRAFT_366566 [Phyllosticta paracitricarpa]|uniref:Uncharacterized protein n=1 Tax=Phyllosticta paracitricarpa TaxID=2016321 RepID=A0ABR1MYC5_9PEZI
MQHGQFPRANAPAAVCVRCPGGEGGHRGATLRSIWGVHPQHQHRDICDRLATSTNHCLRVTLSLSPPPFRSLALSLSHQHLVSARAAPLLHQAPLRHHHQHQHHRRHHVSTRGALQAQIHQLRGAAPSGLRSAGNPVALGRVESQGDGHDGQVPLGPGAAVRARHRRGRLPLHGPAGRAVLRRVPARQGAAAPRPHGFCWFVCPLSHSPLSPC